MIINPIIFDSILFGDLSQWSPNKINETQIIDILNNQVRANKNNPVLFFNALLNALKEHSIHIKIDDLPTTDSLANLATFAKSQSSFDVLASPPFFNKSSELYSYIINNESTRVLSSIATNVKNSLTFIDSSYQVNSLLRNLEYFIKEISNNNFSSITGALDSFIITINTYILDHSEMRGPLYEFAALNRKCFVMEMDLNCD